MPAMGRKLTLTLLVADRSVARLPYFGAEQNEPVTQPIEFDHRHHVSDDGIDCRYCHNTVETSSSAGYPATSVCMNCHAQIWNQSPYFDLVRAGKADAWIIVHCGSSREPYGTLQHFHSKYASKSQEKKSRRSARAR